jgi:23S rRNA pseudouridine2605 synthase
MHPRWQVARRYRVEVTGRLPATARAALDRGVPLADEPRPVRPLTWRFRPAGARGELMVELAEGRSRVVRRLCAALGLGVRRLVRVAYGPIELGTLPAGKSRPLAPRELRDLYAAVQLPLPADAR